MIFKGKTSLISEINELAGKNNWVRFDKGSPGLPIFDFTKEDFGSSFVTSLVKNISKYPDQKGYLPLINIIKDIESEIDERQISYKNVCLTGGCTEGIFYTLGCLLDRNDVVLVNDLSFEGFSQINDNLRLIEKRTALDNFRITEKMVKKYKPKAIIFSSPENPSGKIYSGETLEFIGNLAKRYNIFVIVDEINNQNIYPPFKFVPPNRFIDQKHLISVNSFTKNYFLPSIRVGWIVTDKENADKIYQTRLSFESGLNFVSQYLAYISITKHIENIKEARKKIILKKKFTEKILNKNGLKYLKPVEGGTVFFVYIGSDSIRFSKMIGTKHNIGLIPGYVFGPKWKFWVRLGFGSLNITEIEKGINQIGRLIKSRTSRNDLQI